MMRLYLRKRTRALIFLGARPGGMEQCSHMKLEEISLNHMIPFISMIGDYKEHDPEALPSLFPNQRHWDAAEFRKFVLQAEKDRLDWKPGPQRVSYTRYVLLDDDGSIAGHALLRFPLDDRTEIDGGNVRFACPPSKRGGMNEVHTLNRMLFEAVRAGLARILVTCYEEGDEVRRQAIEMNRGEYQDTVPSLKDPELKVRRYWIRFR